MPDPPKRPKPADLAREARALRDPPRPDPYQPAKPPPGKPWRPAAREEFPPLPTAKPVREDTVTDGMLDAAPGSQGPYRRIDSPPPAELAADADSARSERQRVRKAVADQDSRMPSAPQPEPVRIELPAGLRTGAAAIGKALLGAVAAALIGTGGAVVHSQTSALPPGVAECPTQIEAVRVVAKEALARAEKAETGLDYAREDIRALRKQARELEDEIYRLEKRTPKINP